jgi:hypothetical protein
MHRIVAEDDRRVMATSMNIKEKEAPIVSTLFPLHAVAFSEGDDGAYHIKFPYVKPRTGDGNIVDMIKGAMSGYLNNKEYLSPLESCSKYCNHVCNYKEVGEEIIDDYRFTAAFPRLVLSLLKQVSIEVSLLQLFTAGNDAARTSGNPLGVKICAIVQGSERYFEELGRKYHWSYDEEELILHHFLDMYINSLKLHLENGDVIIDPEKSERFSQAFKELTLNKQPTMFCSQICTDGTCLYRYLISDLLSDSFYHNQFTDSVNKGGPDLWIELISIARNAASELNEDLDPDTETRLVECFILMKANQIDDFSQSHIYNIMSNIFEEINLSKS